MDYEKKYKEALGWIQSLYNGLHGKTKEEAERYFPELKESEDERIRKELIKVFSNREKYLIDQSFGDITVSEAIAWLEKQGEKLPVGFYYVNSEGEKFYSDTFKYGDMILHVEKQSEQKPIDYNEELKKCRENPLYFFDKYVKLKEQKPAWSEEDVIMLKDIISGLEATKQLTYAHDEQGKSQMQDRINWLKSLKDRVQIQSKQGEQNPADKK